MRLNYHTRLRLLLLPYLLGTLLLVVIPAGLAFGLAFFEYDALSPPRWVGGLNFILVYTNELFRLSVQNSLALILLPVPLRLLAALGLALLLRRGGRGLALFRSLAYLPNVIPGAAYALAWLWILNPLYGPLNLILRAAGMDPPFWLGEAGWAKPALILASLWQVGEGFLVSLAALHEIPQEVEEAARVDGATPWQLFWHIVLPLIAPLLLLLSFRDAILSLQDSFVFSYFLTQGGPYYATYTLPYLIYEQAFDQFSFGIGSAALWFMYGLTTLVVGALFLIARQWGVQVTDELSVL